MYIGDTKNKIITIWYNIRQLGEWLPLLPPLNTLLKPIDLKFTHVFHSYFTDYVNFKFGI